MPKHFYVVTNALGELTHAIMSDHPLKHPVVEEVDKDGKVTKLAHHYVEEGLSEEDILGDFNTLKASIRVTPTPDDAERLRKARGKRVLAPDISVARISRTRKEPADGTGPRLK